MKHESNERESGDKVKQRFEFFTRNRFSTLQLHTIGYPSGSIIPLWSWWCLDKQEEVEGWLEETYPEHLTKWSNPQSGRASWGPHNPLMARFISLLDGTKHPGYPVCPFATDAGDPRAVLFVGLPWLSRNQGLALCPNLTAKYPSTQWSTPGIRLRLCTFWEHRHKKQ